MVVGTSSRGGGVWQYYFSFALLFSFQQIIIIRRRRQESLVSFRFGSLPRLEIDYLKKRWQPVEKDCAKKVLILENYS